ncbi:MAG: hypothetical protein HGB21_05820 [Nitrospirae bacterium]|nr:hypothetical protein [Nitrospirota bacterium]NTW65820.1 hypothetical protein [Nitrospirota bacterium]
MNTRLSPPNHELAIRILAAVPYKDRIPAGRLTPRMGITRGSVRGLPELHLYLAPDTRTLPGINLDRLADWIEQVIRDPELAGAVRAATRAAGSHVDGCLKVHDLVGLRLDQAREAAERRAANAPTGEES